MIFQALFENESANVYAFGNDEKNVVLVDPGNNNNNHLINYLRKLKLNVVAIFLTHGHFDHISALDDIRKEFPNAKVYMYYTEIDFLSNDRLNLSYRYLPVSYDYNDIIGITDGDEISLVNLKIKIIHTPFHTSGSICLYINEENILFSGDTLFNRSIGRTDLPTGDEQLIVQSLTKLKNLPDNTKVYPGHGPKTNIGDEKKYNPYLRF